MSDVKFMWPLYQAGQITVQIQWNSQCNLPLSTTLRNMNTSSSNQVIHTTGSHQHQFAWLGESALQTTCRLLSKYLLLIPLSQFSKYMVFLERFGHISVRIWIMRSQWRYTEENMLADQGEFLQWVKAIQWLTYLAQHGEWGQVPW